MAKSIPQNVLVVEDEPLLNRTICDTLEDEEFNVYSAFSGEKALELLQDLSVDVCTVDMRLRGMTGNEFIVKAHKLYPHLRFIIYTGSANYSIPQKLRLIGIRPEHTFSKPLGDLMQLAKTIKTLHPIPDNGNEEKDLDH